MTARKHKRAQWRYFGWHRVNFLLQQGNILGMEGRRARVGVRGPRGGDGEEAGLYLFPDLRSAFVHLLVTYQADVGIKFVYGAVGFYAKVRLGYTGGSYEGSGALVACLGIYFPELCAAFMF